MNSCICIFLHEHTEHGKGYQLEAYQKTQRPREFAEYHYEAKMMQMMVLS